jgi:L-aminopeptidase/D-esterase-like protein
VITDVEGVRVGHWTDEVARTGCTVVLLPPGTVASGEVRGGAPGTREFDLLAPERLVTAVDAVVLTGGSAFGLASCDGVARWCEEHGRGFETRAARIPIVVGMVLYDLAVGSSSVRPDASAGYAACEAATDGPFAVGAVGAGTGATVGKWFGPDAVAPGWIGTATARDGEVVVSALVAVNAMGLVSEPGAERPPLPAVPPAAAAVENTTIGVVVTNARLDKVGCLLVAQAAHDGLARALEPAHASGDGDAVVAAATGTVEAPLDRVKVLAARAFESAIRTGREGRSPSPDRAVT